MASNADVHVPTLSLTVAGGRKITRSSNVAMVVLQALDLVERKYTCWIKANGEAVRVSKVDGAVVAVYEKGHSPRQPAWVEKVIATVANLTTGG